MILRGKYWIILFSFLGLPTLTAKELPAIQSYNRTDYSAHNQNWQIAQLPNGMMAFANSAGVLIFDGFRWSLYSLPDNQIVRAVATDERGYIFCGGYGTFGFWKGNEKGQLQYHDLSQKIETSNIEREEIWNIIVEEDRVLFQSFSEIYAYDYQTIKSIDPPSNIMFLSQQEREIWVPTIDNGIFKLTDQYLFESIPHTELLGTNRIAGILPYAITKKLICTQNNGLFLYEKGKLSPYNFPISKHLITNQLNRVLRLKNGQLVFGTILNGLYITDALGQKILLHLNNENGLQNNTILSLKEDQFHNLWVGLDKGIDYIKIGNPLRFYNSQVNNIGTAYSAIIYQNQLYVATNQGLYFQPLTSKKREGLRSSFQLIPNSQGQVWELNNFDGQLIAGHNLGTYQVKNQEFTPISRFTGGWNTIRVPNRQDLLIQGSYTGLILFKKGNDGTWKASHRLEGFRGPIKKILFDQFGQLWGINPHKGLFRFDIDSSFQTIKSVKTIQKSDGLPNLFRPDIFLVNQQLVVKSADAFFVFDMQQNKFIAVKSIDNLDLQKGNYKVSYFTAQNYFKIYPQYIDWYQGDQSNRLDLSLVSNFEKIHLLADSSLLFCLDNGYARRKGDLENTNSPPIPKSFVSEIQVNGQWSLYPIFQNQNSWIFQPNEQFLQFKIGHAQFTNTLPLYYQLSGWQKDWLPLTEPTKEFTNFSPGDYAFKLSHDRQRTHYVFPFTIFPKWYQTIWAKVLFMLCFIILFWFLFLLHKKRLKLQANKLEKERKRQLHEQRIQTKNEQLQHDLLNKSKELANSTMNLIQKNEMLTTIKQGLLNINPKIKGQTGYKENKKLIRLIDRHLTNNQDWEVFEKNFSQVHDSFFKKLKSDYPSLTPGDLKLSAYLKMNLSSKEIAPLLNISIRGVENKRYRLRTKLQLTPSENLIEVMMKY
jgi:DNA-binding CsgD family transcriptional regulator